MARNSIYLILMKKGSTFKMESFKVEGSERTSICGMELNTLIVNEKFTILIGNFKTKVATIPTNEIKEIYRGELLIYPSSDVNAYDTLEENNRLKEKLDEKDLTIKRLKSDYKLLEKTILKED